MTGKNETIEVTVDGEVFSFGPAQLPTDDVAKAAFHLIKYSELLARAERERLRAEALYRVWRARTTVLAAESHRKGPEWRVKAAVESDPLFEGYKEGLAKAAYNVECLKGVVQALTVLTAATLR